MAEEDDGMYEDDPQDDDEKDLQEALALSMLPEGTGAAQNDKGPNAPAGEAKPAAAQQPPPQVEVDADLMKDVIGELGIELDDNQLAEMLDEAKNEVNKKDEDKDKKDEKK